MAAVTVDSDRARQSQRRHRRREIFMRTIKAYLEAERKGVFGHPPLAKNAKSGLPLGFRWTLCGMLLRCRRGDCRLEMER